jgi:hypothetical protein
VHWIQLAQVGPVVDCCEQDNGSIRYIKSGVFIGQVRNYKLVKNDFLLQSLSLVAKV